MGGIGGHQIYLITFFLVEVIFYIQNTVFLLRLRGSGRSVAVSIAPELPIFVALGKHRQILDEVAVVKYNLFAFFDGVLSIEAEAQAFKDVFGVDGGLGLLRMLAVLFGIGSYFSFGFGSHHG